ncbi:MAG: ATP-dependent metallopeptidase FtsH/Yme1/Tma family protein [Planctomycetales bacterium]|nr:MAG: ATP-dependent metallopeptidase FtsH/Yme1/Tma family protein [Planctomycetales bacterium]
MMLQYLKSANTVSIGFSELVDRINNGEVMELNIEKNSGRVIGKFKPGAEAIKSHDNKDAFTAVIETEFTDELIGMMRENNVKFDIVPVSFWDTLLSPNTLLLVAVFTIPIVFLFWLMNRQMQSGGNNQAINFGKSRARLASDGKKKITFADVAGVDEAVEELREVVDFLRDPKKYEALGAEIPKGVLLIGPPGCGKTHLAKAVAGEANVPFFYISGSDFVEMFVGVGASRVRDLFDQAKRRAPCLIFIDELDAVGRHRGTGIGGTHDEREQTLNQMLVEMDGFEANSGIIVLAATNRPDVLDPALLRPGRFDRRVVVDAPDLGGRIRILEIYTKNKPMSADIDLKALAQRTPGFSGADLKNSVNEAALLAARRGETRISSEDLFEAVDRVVAGPERKSRIINEHEKQVIAYHELGHAIVSHELENTDPVHKISILPRGQALGYTLNFPAEDRFLVSKKQILDRVSMALGGRAAEEIVFGDITTGASNDLERSTQMIRDMITKYGMSEELGPIQFGRANENPFLGKSFGEDRNYSDEVAFRIDEEVRKLVMGCYARALEVLRENRRKMDYLASILIREEQLDRDDFVRLMDEEPPADFTPFPIKRSGATTAALRERERAEKSRSESNGKQPDQPWRPGPAPAG